MALELLKIAKNLHYTQRSYERMLEIALQEDIISIETYEQITLFLSLKLI